MTDKYLTVSALTRYLKRKFELDPHLSRVLIKGEISNFRQHSRGHMYFTLKDEHARIRAVMFASKNQQLKFLPENWMRVLLKGEVSVYETNGEYQLYVEDLQPDGIGSLYLAFEQLKTELEKQGYFSPVHKKVIPSYPEHIAIITSPTGAAIRDIITTIKRRYPIVKLTVFPAIVQGINAAPSIKKAIEQVNEFPQVDLIILGRGGGSIEDLWGFNEKIVAETIFRSKTPIISAVGHETDITISDFVADLRAPTPTGAAELAVPSQTELFAQLIKYRRMLNQMMKQSFKIEANKLDRLTNAYAFRYPNNLIKQKEQELDVLIDRLTRTQTELFSSKQSTYHLILNRLKSQHPKTAYKYSLKDLRQLNKRFIYQLENIIKTKEKNISTQIDKLILLNPLEVMKRGFSIPYNEKGEIIMSSSKLKINDRIILKLTDGKVSCKVLDVKENFNG